TSGTPVVFAGISGFPNGTLRGRNAMKFDPALGLRSATNTRPFTAIVVRVPTSHNTVHIGIIGMEFGPPLGHAASTAAPQETSVRRRRLRVRAANDVVVIETSLCSDC